MKTGTKIISGMIVPAGSDNINSSITAITINHKTTSFFMYIISSNLFFPCRRISPHNHVGWINFRISSGILFISSGTLFMPISFKSFNPKRSGRLFIHFRSISFSICGPVNVLMKKYPPVSLSTKVLASAAVQTRSANSGRSSRSSG